MIILGIDPGTTTTGFGLIKEENGRLKLKDYGVIKTKPNLPLARKLAEIYRDIKKLIKTIKPDIVAVEQIFFFKNTKTAMAVGQARGVILLAAERVKVTIAEFTPLQVKIAICGNGRAKKSQVQDMAKIVLSLDKIPRPDDAADAIAIAVCCANNLKHQKAYQEGQK